MQGKSLWALLFCGKNSRTYFNSGMGVNRHEPTFVQFSRSLEYASCKELFEEKGWTDFLRKFQGYNGRFALDFSQSFNGEVAEIGNFKFTVTEEYISKVTWLPLSHEKSFKRGSLDPMDCAKFLKPTYKSFDWSKRVLCS